MKKGLALVIGLGKGKPAPDAESEKDVSSAEEYDASEKEYAKLILEAAKDGDVDALGESLRGFVRACIRKYSEAGDDEAEE